MPWFMLVWLFEGSRQPFSPAKGLAPMSMFDAAFCVAQNIWQRGRCLVLSVEAGGHSLRCGYPYFQPSVQCDSAVMQLLGASASVLLGFPHPGSHPYTGNWGRSSGLDVLD